MEITSCLFYIVLFAFLVLYLIVPKSLQWIMLLGGSIGFYILNCPFYALIYVAIGWLSTYWGAHYISKESSRHKKLVVVAILITNIAILAILKYTNLGIDTIRLFWPKTKIQHVHFVAPFAISFYTLQMISYLLDVYWSVTISENNPLKLLLYMIFFPQMISGPISRHGQLGAQLFAEHRFEYARVVNGLKRTAWGLCKKLLVAGRLAILVDAIFYNPSEYNGVWVAMSAVLYLFVLYADFSGCMDIVIGISQCMGITLTENFDAPLLSKNVREFWNRWHITLGSFLRDYIMNPLLKSRFLIAVGTRAKKIFGKKQGKKVPSYIAMFFVWTAMGIWHGSDWKYVLGEGLWFWFIIVMGQIMEPFFATLRQRFHLEKKVWFDAFRVIRTILLLTVGFVFFKAESIASGIRVLRCIFSNHVSLSPMGLYSTIHMHGVSLMGFGGVLGVILLLIAVINMVFEEYILYSGRKTVEVINTKPLLLRWCIYWVVVLSVAFTILGSVSNFIYAGF